MVGASLLLSLACAATTGEAAAAANSATDSATDSAKWAFMESFTSKNDICRLYSHDELFQLGRCYETDGKHYTFSCGPGKIEVWFWTDKHCKSKASTNATTFSLMDTTRQDGTCTTGPKDFDMSPLTCGQMCVDSDRDTSSVTQATITTYDDALCMNKSTETEVSTDKCTRTPLKDIEVDSCGVLTQGQCGDNDDDNKTFPNDDDKTFPDFEVATVKMFNTADATCTGQYTTQYIDTTRCQKIAGRNSYYKMRCEVVSNTVTDYSYYAPWSRLAAVVIFSLALS